MGEYLWLFERQGFEPGVFCAKMPGSKPGRSKYQHLLRGYEFKRVDEGETALI